MRAYDDNHVSARAGEHYRENHDGHFGSSAAGAIVDDGGDNAAGRLTHHLDHDERQHYGVQDGQRRVDDEGTSTTTTTSK